MTADFEHFVRAQNNVYAAVREELLAGRKRTHWMWFIFPQLAGLGQSATAARFGIADLPEASAYAAHPILGERLRECVTLANAIERSTARQIFGYPDDLKYRSCLTLFHLATKQEIFTDGLIRFYNGEHDPRTLEYLG